MTPDIGEDNRRQRERQDAAGRAGGRGARRYHGGFRRAAGPGWLAAATLLTIGGKGAGDRGVRNVHLKLRGLFSMEPADTPSSHLRFKRKNRCA